MLDALLIVADVLVTLSLLIKNVLDTLNAPENREYIAMLVATPSP